MQFRPDPSTSNRSIKFFRSEIFQKFFLQIPPKMTTSPFLKVPMSDKDYYQIAINTFQGYADNTFKGKRFWESIKINFEDWTKEY